MRGLILPQSLLLARGCEPSAPGDARCRCWAPKQRSAAERWEEGARLGCRFCSRAFGKRLSAALYEVSSCAGAHGLPHNRLQQKPPRVFPAQGRSAEGKQGRKGSVPGCSPPPGGEFGGLGGAGDGWHRLLLCQGCSSPGHSQHRGVSLPVPPWARGQTDHGFHGSPERFMVRPGLPSRRLKRHHLSPERGQEQQQKGGIGKGKASPRPGAVPASPHAAGGRQRAGQAWGCSPRLSL